MLVRWTIPRFRFDQLMGLAWKVLIPMGVVYLICVIGVVELDKQYGLTWSLWLLLPASFVIMIAAAAIALRMPAPPTRRIIPASVLQAASGGNGSRLAGASARGNS